MSTYFVGIYWGARSEDKLSCAKRVASFLLEVTDISDGALRWYKKATSKKAALTSLPKSSDELASHLKPQLRDIGSDVMCELGFGFAAWTGPDSSIIASLGMTVGASSAAVRNSVVVSFDAKSEPSKELLHEILRAAVSAFDPDSGVVTSMEDMTEHADLPAWELPGIFTYRRA